MLKTLMVKSTKHSYGIPRLQRHIKNSKVLHSSKIVQDVSVSTTKINKSFRSQGSVEEFNDDFSEI